MNPPFPSADPDRTAARESSRDPSATVDATADSTRPRLPDPPADAPAVPGYAITGEIARGGMGRVYAAVDVTLDREVAIKTLLPGANAERFVTESKITAKLPHPNIPPVHALGTLPDGTPFLAMKLIRGQTLSDLLKVRPSPAHDLPRFIQVFEQIAQAVGFAHSRGVIHRDLKPLNVMVGEFGEVQVMDWGLARDMRNLESGVREEGSGSEFRVPGSELTRAGAVMGTPGYMAPEQARGEAVDARADVFALGATLAAVLTGRPAFVGATIGETIQKAASADLADVLTRLDRCGVDGELIAVAKRCLSADRPARPADGRAVAGEVGAYRAGVEDRLRQAETERAEAVVRDGEQRKRRRQFNIAAGTVAGVLLAGVVGTSLGLVEAWKQNGIAQSKEAEATRQEGIAKGQTAEKEKALGEKVAALAAKTQALQEAETNLGYARKGNKLLGSVFGNLRPAQIAMSGRPVQDVLKDNLKVAVQELNESAIGDPLAVAEMQVTLGTSLLVLGEPTLAVDLFATAYSTRRTELGPDHPDTLWSMHHLAEGYRRAGKLDLALPLAQECLKLGRAKQGADHPLTLANMSTLAEVYRDTGKLDLALPVLEECLKLSKGKLGTDHPDTQAIMNNLALGYEEAGKLDLAIPLLEKCLKLSKGRLGADHPDTLTTMNNLAEGYLEAGKLYLALPLAEECLKSRRAKLGPDHLLTLNTMNNLALIYQGVAKVDLALPLAEECFKMLKGKLGADHPQTLDSMDTLAEGYKYAGKLDLAIPLLEECLRLRKARLDADHPNTLTTMQHLAEGYRRAGKLDLALPLAEECLKLGRAKLGADHPNTLGSMNLLAMVYFRTGKVDLAIPLLEETLKGRESNLGPDHPSTLDTVYGLGVVYCDAQEGEKASTTLTAFIAGRRKLFPKDDPGFADDLALVALNLLKCDQFAASGDMLRECLAIREKRQPEAWGTFNTQSLLGATLLGQKNYTDAAPLLVMGYEGLKEREKTIPKGSETRIPEALDRLVQLYTATDKPDEAKKYQELRANYPTAKKEEKK